jgi:5-methylcytosine-specific restriction enzyme A
VARRATGTDWTRRFDDFRADAVRMRAIAAHVRQLLMQEAIDSADLPDLDSDDIASAEGGIALRAHLRRERDPRVRARKLADAKRRGVSIACEVCGFDFGRTYGVRGRDYIECHHRTPLHVTGKTQTKLADLALICSNCHRMIHRTRQWLTVEELCILIAAQRQLSVRG